MGMYACSLKRISVKVFSIPSYAHLKNADARDVLRRRDSVVVYLLGAVKIERQDSFRARGRVR